MSNKHKDAFADMYSAMKVAGDFKKYKGNPVKHVTVNMKDEHGPIHCWVKGMHHDAKTQASRVSGAVLHKRPNNPGMLHVRWESGEETEERNTDLRVIGYFTAKNNLTAGAEYVIPQWAEQERLPIVSQTDPAARKALDRAEIDRTLAEKRKVAAENAAIDRVNRFANGKLSASKARKTKEEKPKPKPKVTPILTKKKLSVVRVVRRKIRKNR